MTEIDYPRGHFRGLVVDALKAGVAAVEGRVFVGRAFAQLPDGPRPVDRFPALLVYADRVRRRSASGPHTVPEFATTLTVTVIARSERATEAAIEAELDALSLAIDVAILKNPDLMSAFQDVAQMESLRDIRAEGDRLVGQEAIAIDIAYAEAFEPTLPNALAQVRMTMDAIDPADPTGAYDPIPGFPAPSPPPRTQGPDGRAEVEIRHTFPTG